MNEYIEIVGCSLFVCFCLSRRVLLTQWVCSLSSSM